MSAAKLLRASERKTDSNTDQKRTLGKLTGSDEKRRTGRRKCRVLLWMTTILDAWAPLLNLEGISCQ